MSVVTVLCPNGRRQTIKITPKTSLLYILEEACRKQNFNPQIYQLKHYKKIVDLSLNVRLANIPNKSVLEMQKVDGERTETDIKIGLQLESGERLLANFNPNNSLWDVLSHWKETLEEDIVDRTRQPIVIYMSKEITGLDDMKSTSLRTLGLTSGNAVLRLIFRKHEYLGNQAHVTAPLTKQIREDPVAGVKALINSSLDNCSREAIASSLDVDESPAIITPSIRQMENAKDVDDDSCSNANTVETFQEDESMDDVSKSTDDVEIPVDLSSSDSTPVAVGDNNNAEEGNIIILGEREAILFNLEDMLPLTQDNLPKDFFELSISDVKYLMRDLKNRRQEIEDTPLITRQLREAKQLTLLNKYKSCYVRIQFPDRLVLQGTFRPIDTVATVMDFVAAYLMEGICFYIYTTPPKTILNPDSRLFELDLVPAATVHFGSDQYSSHYLRPDVRDKVSTMRAASRTAFNNRSSKTTENVSGGLATNVGDGTKRQSTGDGQLRHTSSANKVPKWFKI